MRVRMLEIENFRGVRSGSVKFEPETLLVGGNNVGKSTICEALDLVLGPERLYRRPAISEHDFHKSQYLDGANEPVQILIRAVLVDLSELQQRTFHSNLRRWDDQACDYVDEDPGGLERADEEGVLWALPVIFLGRFDPEEDDFEYGTFFDHPQVPADQLGDEGLAALGQERPRFSTKHKRECGFVFLRTLRTGSRALSLQRGSLLDSILRLGDGGTAEMWEETLANLRDLDPPIGETKALKEVTGGIESRLSKFLGVPENQSLSFFASELTREDLRNVVSLFVATNPNDHLVPRSNQGTGSLNLLVFTLLTFIADLKGGENVIFAMEEPEIALPPHTQRRLTRYVKRQMGQVIVTSHSPYVIEQFDPEAIVMIGHEDGDLKSEHIDPGGLKTKTYRNARREFAEAVLSNSILIVEGGTEAALYYAASSTLESIAEGSDFEGYEDFDQTGVMVFTSDGDGDVDRWAPIFKALGKTTLGCCDKPAPGKELPDANRASFDNFWITDYEGVERLLVEECPPAVLRRFLESVEARDDFPAGFPEAETLTDDETLKETVFEVLRKRKGFGQAYAALLIQQCESIDEFPATILGHLKEIREVTYVAVEEEDPEADTNGNGDAETPPMAATE